MDALGELHAKGIHHGILNKFNVLITPGNEVVFIDFENPTLTTTTTTTTTSGWSDSEIHYGLAFPLSQYVFPSLVLLLKRSCSSRSKSWSRLVWSISVCSVRKYLIPAIYSLIPSRAARWAIVIKARLSIQTARTANLHHRDDFHRQF